MKRTKKKRKLNGLGILLLICLLLLVVFLIYRRLNVKGKSLFSIYNDMYVASTTNAVSIYDYDDETKTLTKLDEELTRGTKVSSDKTNITYEEVEYTKVKLENGFYYVETTNLKNNKKDVVLEDTKYVRTSATIYKNEKDSKIESLVKKGNSLKILDYDYLKDDGSVNMYKIDYDGTTGWVYGKYLVDTKELAQENYNENSIYDIHKDRKYSMELYGGEASTLDYYPYEKPIFEDNPLMKDAKAMYLNAATIGNIDSYLKIAKNNGVNTIVVDIKDGALAYTSEVAKEYSPTAYATAINDNDDYKKAIDKIKEAGIYVVGRIVVFNDVHYGKDHEDECISGSTWPSAYSRGAWEYNVELAKEAVKLMGFNEIQFDYVRFPETAYRMSVNDADFKNTYNEEKAEAIQNFLFYAADQIHKENVYLSVDVFGECSSTYVTAYGQYWPAISNIVDVISSMPYTDHFGRNVDTWTNAYKTVNNWAKGAAERQTEIPTPAIARTWITAYDTPYWNPTVIYGQQKIEDQVNALYDAGLTGGFITWNGKSSLSKYEQIKGAFSKDYGQTN